MDRRIRTSARRLPSKASHGTRESGGLGSLPLARAVSGFASGGLPPPAATSLPDVMPPRRRGALRLACTGLGSLRACSLARAGGRVSAALAPVVLLPVLLPVLAADGPHAVFGVVTPALVPSGLRLLGGPRGLSGRTVA